jgi:hypothetical protein
LAIDAHAVRKRKQRVAAGGAGNQGGSHGADELEDTLIEILFKDLASAQVFDGKDEEQLTNRSRLPVSCFGDND